MLSDTDHSVSHCAACLQARPYTILVTLLAWGVFAVLWSLGIITWHLEQHNGLYDTTSAT